MRPQRFVPGAWRTLCLVALCAALGCASQTTRREGPSSGTTAAARPASAAASGKAHLATGRDLLKRGLLDEAEREFRLAIEADPNDLEAVAGLGQVEVARGQYSEGMAHLERATRVLSQMVSALRSLGDAYAATGDLTRAASAYRQAVALAPTDLEARLALVRSLTEIGEYGEARSACADAIRLAKGNPTTLAQAYRQMGEVYSREGNTPEGFASLYKSAELDPRNTQTAKSLATCAVRAGLYAEAAAAYARVLKLAPLDVEAKKQLAWVNFKMERYPIAIKHYEAVGDSLGTVDRYYLAQAYAKSNRADRAVELFRDVVRIDPDNYKGVYCNMAYAYYEANRYQRAIEVAREGLAKDSSSACLRFCWAQALDKLGRHEEAIPVFETVLNDPAYAESAKRELERQRRIVRLLKSKERGGE
ncbi:MAG TPA: tetratricopeptide repeat protein [Candidatus Dormibacteraeota bacterium]|nr:tetratricopeptide repeat protein [Candidatus Dormibacteraeota bacterium]